MLASNSAEAASDDVTPKSRAPVDTLFGASLTRSPDVATQRTNLHSDLRESHVSHHTTAGAVDPSMPLGTTICSYSDEGVETTNDRPMLSQSSAPSVESMRSSLSRMNKSKTSHHMNFENEPSVLLLNEPTSEMIGAIT